MVAGRGLGKRGKWTQTIAALSSLPLSLPLIAVLSRDHHI